MKPVDRRKLLSAMHRLARNRAVILDEEPEGGRGSHGSLIFSTADGTAQIRVVIVYSRYLTPVVQRNVLRYLDRLGADQTRRVDTGFILDVTQIFKEALNSLGS